MKSPAHWFLISLLVFLPATRGRPEAPAPYFYSAPHEVQNPFTRTSNLPSAALSQSYLPPERASGHSQPIFNHIPTSSYGAPLLRTSVPQRNYGSPEELQHPVNIQKHIYVHVAPPEMEEPRPQRIQNPKGTQKHYKIIFVKVPEFAPKYVEQPQVQEEKTLIYVLVKKPEEEGPVRANQVAAPIHKPEVYFVKYKGKEQVQTEGGSEKESEEDDSVVVESAGRKALKPQAQAQGYKY